MSWHIDSWKDRPHAQEIAYDDADSVQSVVSKLRQLPPLVTSWEVERLKQHIAEAQEGKRFLLQGGDCAETLADCQPGIITNKLKILLQMSLVLVHAAKKPVVRVGRLAGQYAKPRSKATEERDGLSLPSYFGDLVNRPEFTAEARRADPRAMLDAYGHSALTLNFVRSLSAGGFADLHHPEYWDLAFLSRADLPLALREEYIQTSHRLSEALRFMEALGETTVDELTRVEFFTSHEGLNLHYESAQTRRVPRREGHYLLTTHLPWIGERTREIDGAHVEFFRGIQNVVGVKLGPKVDPKDAIRLFSRLNPENEAGKLVAITRMGAAHVQQSLAPLVDAVRNAGIRVLWVCDPMHGNTKSTNSGLKTRSFDDILFEIEQSFAVHHDSGTFLGGVHFELTGDDVTECIGGGLTEEDLDKNYASVCDPRLNYRQALEMAFRVGQWMGKRRK
ncbi:2-keto-3-deoxy-D-arabino-heptulosonate-7-phosphate synthase II [Labilithrix luteola]|uniref:Phospho-2-dehydro-3-deoxyheptonate aldolase n=1 Tax=Labilithrix luteola TaxID=1391654 RepID=A0A0K1PRY4_9BACT|nr:3-deoxy-7-phosphoheptulonate synthase class II [Labilithrix luteola]AKU96272.1 2-keto-3-deoxy-D-arabino-heptulosonate-7-phosphate synthase II [Labilithrix luteola]